MALGQVQVAARGLQIGMAEQELNSAQVGAGFEQVGCERVPQGMRVDMFVDPCPRGRLLHGVPYAFGCDGEIDVGMTAFAREQVSFSVLGSPSASSREVPVAASD